MKRRRFVSGGDKTTSFLFYLFLNKKQNDVVLDKTAAKRRRNRFGAAVAYPKRRRFGFVKATSKRRRFAVVLFKTTSFCYRQNFKKNNMQSQNDVVLAQKK